MCATPSILICHVLPQEVTYLGNPQPFQQSHSNNTALAKLLRKILLVIPESFVTISNALHDEMHYNYM